MSLQKESEWEKTIKEIADELWELLPPDFFYKNVDRKTMYNWIRTRLENVISNREKEIADEVKKKVGLMRQWLNEDRITDNNKMVTSEELLHWLKH